MDSKNNVIKFDGRYPHEVVTNNFRGDRFTVIWFKNYDHRIREPPYAFPRCDKPCCVA